MLQSFLYEPRAALTKALTDEYVAKQPKINPTVNSKISENLVKFVDSFHFS